MAWKNKLKEKLPRTFRFLKTIKQLKSSVKRKLHTLHNWNHYGPYIRVSNLIYRNCGGKVVSGPFQGMQYLKDAHGSVLAPKLLGTYEKELIPYTQKIIDGDYDNILDVGCAEGYYAVGFALQSPQSQIYAYDVMFKAQKLCRKLADANHCKNVDIRGLCEFEEIKKLSHKKSFIFCDIEGAELQLFDPQECPEIKNYDFLIEMHDNDERNISDKLVERFQESHEITIIKSQPRTENDADLDFLAPQDRMIALEELRGKECWGYFVRKNL